MAFTSQTSDFSFEGTGSSWLSQPLQRSSFIYHLSPNIPPLLSVLMSTVFDSFIHVSAHPQQPCPGYLEEICSFKGWALSTAGRPGVGTVPGAR